MSPAQEEDSCSEYSQTSSSCLGPEPKKDRPTTARMGQQAVASIRNWILATRCMGDSSGEKPRNGHGTNLERSRKPWNCPERLQKGPRKAPERSWLPLLSPSLHPPTYQTGPGVEGPPPPSVGWCHSTKGGREGRGGLDLGPQMTRCMLSDRYDEASP